MGWIRGMLESRTEKLNKAAGITPDAKASVKKKKRTKISEFTNKEIEEMSDEDYLKLEMDI